MEPPVFQFALIDSCPGQRRKWAMALLLQSCNTVVGVWLIWFEMDCADFSEEL